MNSREPGPQAGSIASSHPLLEQPSADPARLASALKKAVNQSGLFYESHLQQWASGSRTLELLKLEPQASLPSDLTFPAPDTPASDKAATAQSQQQVQWLQQNLAQQLAILNQPAVAWSGQLWPRQFATLQAKREAPHPDTGADRWTSRLSLDMPRLGRIDILISLSQLDIELDIRTGSAQARQALDSSQGALSECMTHSGCRLKRVSLANNDEQA
jgi:flagellar hook-length control protein FliK